MSEIYPMWVTAHGILIVTPVHWYSESSPVKLMMDRLVCAEGGNPGPMLTHGKDAKEAKAREPGGWSYRRHLAGRFFALVAQGDVEGIEGVRRSLADIGAQERVRQIRSAARQHVLSELDPLRTRSPG